MTSAGKILSDKISLTRAIIKPFIYQLYDFWEHYNFYREMVYLFKKLVCFFNNKKLIEQIE